MIEENHDPRTRNDGTQHRVNGVLAETYAAVCQAEATAKAEAETMRNAVDIVSALRLDLTIILSQVKEGQILANDVETANVNMLRAARLERAYARASAESSPSHTGDAS
jgi:hypothetical protein